MTEMRSRRLLLEGMKGQEQVSAPPTIDWAVVERVCDIRMLLQELHMMNMQFRELFDAR